MTSKSPTALIILDGWGHRADADADDNAIARARTPVWDSIWHDRPHCLISGSGKDVGLPDGQMGNSEVGHMNLGAGRVIHQDLTRITQAIEDRSFFENRVLARTMAEIASSNKALHLFGLVSPGGVHSHEAHIKAAIDMGRAAGIKRIYVHAFLDGRDVPPRSAEPSLTNLQKHLCNGGEGTIASVVGRYYAMDRDNRWERIEQAFRLITDGEADFVAKDPVAALMAAYDRDESDEFVKATAVRPDGEVNRIEDGDAVVFMNFRADRARQLTRVYTEQTFNHFEPARLPRLSHFVCLTEYAADIKAEVAFTADSVSNSLGEYIASLGMKQLRLAETEKYAHVTFFFSGGREKEFSDEERILIPSPDVATYDLKPEMSAQKVTDHLVEAINSDHYQLIVCNYANGDMVGHTGNFEAAVQAVEFIDECLGRVINALGQVGGQCLITADHGNVEQMSDQNTRQPHTAHTSELVPLVYIGPRELSLNIEGGVLSDVAPTLLDLMELDQPGEMTGHSLVISPEIRAASS
ncbi:MAG: 2,3-bisphosphoglycerate-independent phosphoglycerate mutase [Gammaproteobacteria bacterium]|jgi:2,3-bisphosphoglycerate-independent phosphoglycerate mutase|nr:2,3-bisphosphoglycerate-independent phosphoglycerate mutase [Gammaproteobacteria bacterium]MBT4493437.1 2,3-bisphosphoglycerate-independent phosphoglycerate mutase [Gammaproteobacteria bacterium]MBT7369238.1 2,3-bisphosphoglycerate-independent phosphoglycerate mutase [Gammaproteobacteria bacterium]